MMHSHYSGVDSMISLVVMYISLSLNITLIIGNLNTS